MEKIKNEDLGRLSVSDFQLKKKISLIIVLDNVRSMHNTGSIFRTADAFGCEKIFLCGFTGCPPHREINKTALGATESVEWKYFSKTTDALSVLKNDGYKVIAVEQAVGCKILESFSPNCEEKIALIFGNEVDGIDQKVMNEADDAIELQQHGTKHSLNVSVCAGIVIHHFSSKMYS